jgi:RNA polymerase sigma-70 factor, ECF subfamily
MHEKIFADFYTEHKSLVWKLTKKYFFKDVDREEAFQDSFVKVYKQLKKGPPPEQIKGWLYRVTINTCINQDRKTKRQQVLFNALSFNGILFDQSETVLESSDEQELERIMSPLNAKQKAVIILREIEELTYDEISKTMSISIGTVKSTLNRAKNKIKNYLEQRQ